MAGKRTGKGELAARAARVWGASRGALPAPGTHLVHENAWELLVATVLAAAMHRRAGEHHHAGVFPPLAPSGGSALRHAGRGGRSHPLPPGSITARRGTCWERPAGWSRCTAEKFPGRWRS